MDVQELGRYSERLLAEWRQQAVSHLRVESCHKEAIRAELAHRHPHLQHSSLSTEDFLTTADYSFNNIAQQFLHLL